MRTVYFLTTTFLLIAASIAWSQTDPACWNRDMERMDFYTNPPEGGDNNFFTGITNMNASTNVVLLYPAKNSMKHFSQKLYRIKVDLHDSSSGNPATGCTNTYLNNLTYFMPTYVSAPAGAPNLQGVYNPATTYPDPGPTYSGGSGQSDGLSTGANGYYRYGNWPVNGGGTAESSGIACNSAGGPGQVGACQACLNLRGYWLNPSVANNDISTAAGVFSTNWLRFHPTKWVILSLAYKRLVNGPLLSILREAVVATNGTSGGQVVQKMLPQSCNGQGRPMNQKLGAIDSLSYSSNANPLAEMLFNTAWYMAGQQNPWVFTNSATQGGPAMQNGRSGPCNNCSGDFAVLFSDGRGDTANPACNAYADGGMPPQCTAAARCSTLGMGGEDDGNDYLDPSMAGGAGPTITGAGVRQTPGGTCDMDFADDVAGWMATNNVAVGTPVEKIKTFVVGVGDPANAYGDMTTLQQVAAAGLGVYTVADDFQTLEANINRVLSIIITRATSFSAAAIQTVQTQKYTSAIVPRFRPNGSAQWQGTLLRFNLFNEFSAGCTSADYGIVDSLNPNGNSSCYDVYLTDQNNNFIGEDTDGKFGVLDNSATWDAGWPFRTLPDGGIVPATPFWEAAANLTSRMNSVLDGGTNYRTIYTVAPNGTTGQYSPTLVPFNIANLATITPLLKLGGVNGDLCTTLGFLSRHAYSTESDCATDVINFMLGYDVLLQNPYNRTIPQPSPLHARPNILGDIFHSSPVLVTPPAPTFFCDLGILNQCVSSLYSSTLTPDGGPAYQSYFNTNQYRTELVVVGSNDGMIHAFNGGNDTLDGGVHTYDMGTGKEEWAFIPPDLLPKLIRYIIGERHELFVDGTPMVRDIWVDGSGASAADGVKQADEFHTIAILGEREGGRSYIGLDVTNPAAPAFRWMWPPPGTTEALNQGESWNDLGPAPAAIGPIAEYSATGPLTVNGVSARERYVAAIGGGWDPAFLRGRAFYVLDAWDGTRLYRYSAMDSTGPSDLRNKLYPVASPVSLIDTNGDGLFDTAVFGDTGGQVWTVSMLNPATLSGGRYNNWYAGRSFIQFKGQPFWHRSPFFQRPVIANVAPNVFRAYLGSGDRDQIKDPDGGTCGLPNLSGCMRQNCSVSVTTNQYRTGPSPAGAAGGHYVTDNFTYTAGGSEPTQTISTDTISPAQQLVCSDVDDVNISSTITCGGTTVTYPNTIYCDWGGADGGVDCPTGTGRPPGASISYTPAVAMEDTRFYAIRLFDSANRQQFSSPDGSLLYDSNALTDSDLLNAVDGGSVTTDNGWYLAHAYSIDEKTASGALLLGGCTFWNTLVPNPNRTVTCGATTLPLDTAYTYQADAITGGISCGAAGSPSYVTTSRTRTRTTYVPPQQPALVLSMNPITGQVAYGGVSLDPGSAPISVTTGTGEVYGGTIHWLEVPRKVHECRHNGTNCN